MSEENDCENSQEDKTPGIFSWQELVTQDPAASTAFYSDLFGWTTETMPMPTGDYTFFNAGERPVAGMVKPPKEDVPTSWIGYVTVEDLDATVAKAEGLGAHVLRPRDGRPGQGPLRLHRRPTGGNDRVLAVRLGRFKLRCALWSEWNLHPARRSERADEHPRSRCNAAGCRFRRYPLSLPASPLPPKP